MKARARYICTSFIATIILISCTTSNYVVSESANMEKYRFASISDVMGYTGSANLMDMDVRIFDIVETSGLVMIGEKEIQNLTKEEQEALLLVKYSATQSEVESVASITFVDYVTLKPVATARGAFSFGWTEEQDMNVALNRVKKQVKMLFEKR